jgi:hypothetical protein
MSVVYDAHTDLEFPVDGYATDKSFMSEQESKNTKEVVVGLKLSAVSAANAGIADSIKICP